MIQQLRPALVLLIVFTLLTGLAYPYAISGIAHALFPQQAGGSLIERDGKIVGSVLIGQRFDSPRYFHGRPSATVATDPNDATKTIASPYNAANSSGSNLGPTSKALLERVASDSGRLHAENPGAPIPVDLITASASGLDPDISPAAAQFQIPRVAVARGLSDDEVLHLIPQHTRYRWLGLFGEPVVNVLELNLALDRLGQQSQR
jgi:K+-transporting ATPase ATPase C chain